MNECARHAEFLAIHALLAHGRPDAYPVCQGAEGIVRWREFSGRVATAAEWLSKRAERRWLLASDDALTFAIGLLALLHAAKEVVIPPNAQAGTLHLLAGAFDARFADAESALANAGWARPASSNRLTAIDPQHAVIDLYTSGSTGRPKQVRKNLAQFEAEVETLEALWGCRLGTAAIVATVPHQHIYGLLFRLFWPLSSGRVFDAAMCSHPGILEERLALFQSAALISSPAHLTRLPQLLQLSTLAAKPVAVFSSGGPLPASAAHELGRALAGAPIEIFGSTETGGVAWRRQDGATDEELWTPFPCHEISRSTLGALLLRSPFLEDNPWEMDDAIEQRQDGRFRLLGRLDRVVKVEGKRLSLPDMEMRLEAHELVDQAAALALSGRRQSIAAVVALNAQGKERLAAEGRRGVSQRLRKHLAEYFEEVVLPRRWRFPDRLPVNEGGKLAHALLADLFSHADDDNLSPEIVGIVRPHEDPHAVVLDLHIPSQLAHFAGHFPDAAILPGVVQIDWAIRFARKYCALHGEFSALENLKFLAVILPGAKVQLSLKWDGERLEFAYSTALRKHSSGRVIFGGAR
jgi:acyl-coenzyme A synthetase/AMP-(fatty) acid ligase/3-hydroxymyristoyl/3-hydroxydecanoyl-(acyl carrier protein) dehydratase